MAPNLAPRDDSSDAGGKDVVASGTVVDSAGGSVDSSDGLFTVEIPPGALTQPTPIEVEPVEPETVDIDPTLLAGEVCRLSAIGHDVRGPVVTIRRVSAAVLGVDDDVLPFFAVLQRDAGPWTPISNEARRDADTILVSATIDHFSENAAIGFTQALGVENAIRLELTLQNSPPLSTVSSRRYRAWSCTKGSTHSGARSHQAQTAPSSPTNRWWTPSLRSSTPSLRSSPAAAKRKVGASTDSFVDPA